MKTYPLQTSFAGGEISNKVLGRSETVIYQQAASVMQNFIPDSRGPALDRGGSEFQTQNVAPDDFMLLEDFQVSGSVVYNIRFVAGVIAIATPDGDTPSGGASHVTPYTIAQVPDIRVVRTPSGNTMYILHGEVQTQKLVYTVATDTFTFGAVTFTSKPASWTGTNWPSVGTMFQGRLWLGNTPSGPQTFWASKSGLPEDFSVSGTLVASDAILGIVMEYLGAIQWMIGTKNLIIGTLTGEYLVRSDTGVITPMDIQVERQSTFGSRFADAIMIGTRIFHITADGRKVRMMEYSFSRDNWVSDEANYFADHLSYQDPFIKIVWLPNPEALMFALHASGQGAYFVWEGEADVHGWSPYISEHPITSCASGLIDGHSVLTMSINRNTGFVDLEYTSLSSTDAVYNMDSWIRGIVAGAPSPGTSISGLDHLDGFDCQVLTDGAVHPNRTPVGGAITLEWDATVVIVGLQYIPKLTTLPIETGVQGGSGRSHFKQFNRFLVFILESALPKINGTRPPTRNPSTPMDEPEPLITDNVEITILGWDRKAQITIEQDLPLPLNISSVAGELSQENY